MLFKPCALLLLIAVTVVVAQEAAQPATRQRANAASRRTKLFEEQQQQQAEKVTASGQRRRLVAKTRVGSSRTTTTEAPTTTTAPPTTTTEAPSVTEPFFEEIEQVDEEPEVPTFRPRPAVVQSELPAFRPRTSRPPVVIQQTVEEEIEEEEEPVQVVRQKPLAGPTRTRTQATSTVSRPVEAQRQIQQQSTAPALSKPTRTRGEAKIEEKNTVETVRRYSFEGDDGSFTFGYENADGSFKEETRGADCIVRGKYGYIDPDGIKREFNYQTGNQCVPGEKTEEEEAEDDDEEAPVRAPVRRPNVPQRRPNIPERRPVVAAQQDDDEERQVTEVLNTPTRISKPATPTTAQRVRPAPVEAPVVSRRPTIQAGTVDFDSEVQRLFGSSQATPRPAAPVARPTAAPARPIFNDNDDDEAFVERRPLPQTPVRSGAQSFSTELVFDRNNNQFSSQLSQRIPETNEEISIREKLGGFIFNPRTTTPEPVVIRQQQQPSFVPQQPQQQQFLQETFSAPVDQREVQRQAEEARRQQLETERLQAERQRIAEENAVAQRRPAIPAQPSPQIPDFSGFSQPRFQPIQQPTFGLPPQRAQQQPQQPIPVQQRPTFATGQIDSFLSSLG